MKEDYELFSRETKSIIYGFQAAAIQRMLDFDFVCKRNTPSVAAIIRPSQTGAIGYHKVFWGGKEIVIPIYRRLAPALKNHPDADVMVNFSSFRSAYPTTKEALESDTIRTVAVIAEGVPERQSRELIKLAKEKGKMIIGPATVGGMKAGAFKIGNTAGTIENIVLSKLYRTGSVGLVSKSGGMSNELNFMIAENSDGVYEAIAIGGDRYAGSTLLDHLLRFEAIPKIKMHVCLGEVGGTGEIDVAEALKDGRIKKPLVMWCIGTAAKLLPAGLQFGHAGAMAGTDLETAEAKNRILAEAGAIVPSSYDELGEKIRETFNNLKADGKIEPVKEFEPPKLPIDYAQASRLGIVRRPTDVVCTISDERGDVPMFSGVGLDTIVRENKTIGYTIGLLWFKKELPQYAQDYIEMVIKLTADHGPAVSGAHNAIITARAGRDLMSSLSSGILTIGPRFGGAISDAAKYIKEAVDKGMKPVDFVDYMKNVVGINIPGIGHRIKSVQNPDVRVTIMVDFAKKNFPKTETLDYALSVEKLTTAKRNNLILNVDGVIGVLSCDMLRGIGYSRKEVREFVDLGILNAFFVLGRSIGFMGHIMDQKRLKSGLYRHPWDDIQYMMPDKPEKVK